jgi:hypothetical protein
LSPKKAFQSTIKISYLESSAFLACSASTLKVFKREKLREPLHKPNGGNLMATISNKNNYNCENHSHNSIISSNRDLSQSYHNSKKLPATLLRSGYTIRVTELGFIIDYKNHLNLGLIDFEKEVIIFFAPKLVKFEEILTGVYELLKIRYVPFALEIDVLITADNFSSDFFLNKGDV